MKKKSPPYAIIGAALLGIIVVILYLQHEKSVQAEAAAAMQRAHDDMQHQIDDLNRNKTAPVVVTPTETHMRKVLYATQPINPGMHMSPAFFEVKLTPEDILPDAYTEADSDGVVGMYAVRNIEKGDPLTPRNVSKDLPFMEGRIAPGMRAISLPIFNGGDVNSTGGFVIDGDKVDLLTTRISTDGNEQYDTQMLLQNLTVLYVPGTPNRTNQTTGLSPAVPPGGTIAVMFEVTPEQAQALINITHSKNNRLSMILRSRRDNTIAKIKPYVGGDYDENPKKFQKMSDTSSQRVLELQKDIQAAEAKNQAQGNTNAPPTTPAAP